MLNWLIVVLFFLTSHSSGDIIKTDHLLVKMRRPNACYEYLSVGRPDAQVFERPVMQLNSYLKGKFGVLTEYVVVIADIRRVGGNVLVLRPISATNFKSLKTRRITDSPGTLVTIEIDAILHQDYQEQRQSVGSVNISFSTKSRSIVFYDELVRGTLLKIAKKHYIVLDQVFGQRALRLGGFTGVPQVGQVPDTRHELKPTSDFTYTLDDNSVRDVDLIGTASLSPIDDSIESKEILIGKTKEPFLIIESKE